MFKNSVKNNKFLNKNVSDLINHFEKKNNTSNMNKMDIILNKEMETYKNILNFCLPQSNRNVSLDSLNNLEINLNENKTKCDKISNKNYLNNFLYFRKLIELFSFIPLPLMSITGMGLLFLITAFFTPKFFADILLYPIFRLVFALLYPAYASFKTVRSRNVKDYVKWMMYWVVYAFFACIETFTDIFLSWFPFYYELKIIIVVWLLSPTTKGSTTLYKKFVHPILVRKEQDIDEYLNQGKEKCCSTFLELGTKGLSYASNIIVQTALKGGGDLVQTIRRSYSLSDLSEPDINRTKDEVDQVVKPQRMIRQRSNTVRSTSGGRKNMDMYFTEMDVGTKGANQNYNYIRSSEDISSGYSSAEPISCGLSRTASMTTASKQRFKAKRTEEKNISASYSTLPRVKKSERSLKNRPRSEK